MRISVNFPIPGVESVTDQATKDWIQNVLQPQASKWGQDLTKTLVGMIDERHAPVMIPATTIDLGGSAYAFASGANAIAGFNRWKLPNTTTTTSSALQTALNYTGRGVLQCVGIVSQVAGGASTAAGVSVKITIDGNVVYNAMPLGVVNNGLAVVGQLIVTDPTNDYVPILNDPIGLPFNGTCKVEFASGTNGQGVSIGWRVSKKL